MHITITAIPAFKDNYIWCLNANHSNATVVVDPGDAQAVFDYLEAQQRQLTAILVTHHHPDHTAGIAELVAQYSVPVYGFWQAQCPEVNMALSEEDEIELTELKLTLKILEIPGHTLDHIAFYSAETETPFALVGDTLFSAGCGRVFEGTMTQMYQSLMKLATLPEATLIYCTHEYTEANLHFALKVEPENPAILAHLKWVQQQRAEQLASLPTTLKQEKLINPFLRCQEPAVIASALAYQKEHGIHLDDGDVGIFEILRLWKNQV